MKQIKIAPGNCCVCNRPTTPNNATCFLRPGVLVHYACMTRLVQKGK